MLTLQGAIMYVIAKLPVDETELTQPFAKRYRKALQTYCLHHNLTMFVKSHLFDNKDGNHCNSFLPRICVWILFVLHLQSKIT
jgi:hypothetical protein